MSLHEELALEVKARRQEKLIAELHAAYAEMTAPWSGVARDPAPVAENLRLLLDL